MQQKLEEKDENTLEIKETFSSLQQEVDSKTKKLKKVSLFGLENAESVLPNCKKPNKQTNNNLNLSIFIQILALTKKVSILRFLASHREIRQSCLQCQEATLLKPGKLK